MSRVPETSLMVWEVALGRHRAADQYSKKLYNAAAERSGSRSFVLEVACICQA